MIDDSEVEYTGSGKPAVGTASLAPAQRITLEEAKRKITAAEREIAEAERERVAIQQRVARAQRGVADARAHRATVIASQGTPTRMEVVRAYQASEQEKLRQIAAGAAEPTTVTPVGNSVVDRMAQRFGGADAYARKSMVTGFRRGSLPQSMQGRRVKLPSDR